MIPRYNNAVYYIITVGRYFGLEDIIKRRREASEIGGGEEECFLRCFNVMTMDNVEALLFKVEDIQKMQIEFPKAFNIMFEESGS